MLKFTSALVVAVMVAAAAAAFPDPVKTPPTTKETAKSGKLFDLMVGDKAPELSVTKWLKGSEVTGFEKGHVYVVEFWATWCGPCIKGMPHLSKLQKEYKDQVTIIGVTSKDSRGNTQEAVEKMVANKGDTMGYTVAWDDERKTNEAYMKAGGQRYIPCAFIVDKTGTIAYVGNDPDAMDEPLKQIVNGTYDLKAAIEKYRAKCETDKLVDDATKAVNEKRWADAYKIAETFITLAPDRAKDAAQLLNEIAWTQVNPEKPMEKPDLDVAMKAATKAVEVTQCKDAEILDTLARVYFVKGDVAKAIELQTKAVELAPDQMKAEIQKTLGEYKAAKK